MLLLVVDSLNIKLFIQGGAYFHAWKLNISPQEKIKAVKEFLSGNGSEYTIAEKYGVSRSGFRRWVLKFFFSTNL